MVGSEKLKKEKMNMVSKNKKYIVAAIAAIGSGIVYLIMHYGGTYKWWILGLYVVIAFLAYHLYISRNNNSI